MKIEFSWPGGDNGEGVCKRQTDGQTPESVIYYMLTHEHSTQMN